MLDTDVGKLIQNTTCVTDFSMQYREMIDKSAILQ